MCVRRWIGSALLQIMVCRLIGTKPLSGQTFRYSQELSPGPLVYRNKLQCNCNQNRQLFISGNASEYIVCEITAILSRGANWTRIKRMLSDHRKALSILMFGLIFTSFIVRRAGLLWSQQDFEWRWSVPLFKCLTVLEFSFILFDLCLLITFFNFIMNYVPIVTFWIFTYHKIWILSIMFCFIWSYWIIYFLACLEVSWRVVS